ncbi:RISC-loading complex subunit tarbp2-like [Diachasmimorpha longicaudata]|uniref:RISC-loading complex subunit tarbp2-like n=1 Tax=Diachasmimorpha longicaudata TaxID=58733 RepID=UPI0030B88D90
MMKTAVSALQEYLQKNHASVPNYTVIDQGNATTFTIRCECLGLSADGEASNKKTAKHRAAGNIIKLIGKKHNRKIYYDDTEDSDKNSPSPRSNITTEAISPSPVSTTDGINHIGQLNEWCASRRIRAPMYSDVGCSGPCHSRLFTIECKIGNQSVSKTASTKKAAKQEAASAMRNLLKINLKTDLGPDLDVDTNHQDFPALSELIIDVNAIRIEEHPKLASATEKAKTFYPTLTKLGKDVNDTNISIADYHLAFKASFDPQIITSFFAYYNSLEMTELSTKSCLGVVFQRMVDILGVTFETRCLKVIQTRVYVVVYKLKFSIVFAEVGIGDSSENAHVDALRRLIGAMYALLA